MSQAGKHMLTLSVMAILRGIKSLAFHNFTTKIKNQCSIQCAPGKRYKMPLGFSKQLPNNPLKSATWACKIEAQKMETHVGFMNEIHAYLPNDDRLLLQTPFPDTSLLPKKIGTEILFRQCWHCITIP